FAVGEFRDVHYGAKGNLNIWEPDVSPTQFSLASILIAGGSNEKFQGIRAGWIVYQWLNRNHTRLYTYWTVDGFIKTGCYNTLCPGYIQVSTKIPLGFLFQPVSTYGGQQYEVGISIYQDDITGDWWLMVFDELVGYWPKSLFTEQGISQGANLASWGGEVYSPVKEKSPSMGSGHFPSGVMDAAKERREIPSEEEKEGLERQLKAINKPAIKTFKTRHGEIFDCIDIHKQLVFDHHLLKNHSVQLKPTTVPEWINISERDGSFQILQEGINCPDGTVIVRRTTMQNLINARRLKSMGLDGPRNFLTERTNTDLSGQVYFATVDYGPRSFYGVKGILNLWDPQVSQDQFSLAYMAIGGGDAGKVASISVGWMVNPSVYQNDHVHLYASWIAPGKKTGCYDITCPGFVQVSKNIPLGALLQPVSVYNGTQYQIDLTLYQDPAKGDWWFAYRDENVGYWPAALFMTSIVANKANYASWGGQAYSPVTEKTPVMGSGHWPNEGLEKAAYVNGIKIMDNSGNFWDPAVSSLKVRETNSTCYKAMYVHEDDEPWLRAVYYGGPAGCIGK
ncbi:hypothetical protein AALP_AA7G062300, partial [Arabis alpina]